ncbi:SRPBCC family protein [Variovorax sp. PAMC 28711]|uniref:SRPBCC family protein n=1 Tax=Variovorax sp. PAMC 28711 TaxID=1795631 RepID=UPI00078C29D4|nr:SRPBCC family protein [Variovorax sp. PAMC 28711]AMM26377.1 polyketide cyclase [Variovorax sp. PAMC 28711]
MSSIYKQIDIEAPAQHVWEAVRDWGALATRLVPGFVTHVVVEPQARVVTFANGMTVRELILSVDDAAHRLAYSAVGGRAAHHNASVQVFRVDDGRCQLVWITDLLPDTLTSGVNAMVEEASGVMKQTLERAGFDALSF